MAVTTTNLGVITAYGDAVAAGYTGTKAEWQALMASYATVGQQAVDAKNDAVAAKNTAVAKATEATTAANTATTKASEASASAQSIAQSAAQIQENTDDIDQLKSEITDKSDTADMLKAFPTDTASGSVASFADGANVPVKSLIVNIDPVQSGSGDPSPTNVRPISGWTGAVVSVTGYNLFDKTKATSNSAINSQGVVISGSYYVSDFIPVKPDTDYYIKNVEVSIHARPLCFYGVDKGFLSAESVSGGDSVHATSFVRHIPTNVYYIRIMAHPDYIDSAGVNYPSTDTDYHPYSGQSINIALGQTVYGGTLDVTKGELVIDMAMVDLGTLNWTYVSESISTFRSYDDIGAKPAASASAMPNAICSASPVIDYVSLSTGASGVTVIFSQSLQAGHIWVGSTSYTDAASFKTAMNGVQLCYELATPLTITLDPVSVSALYGSNNIWADSGDSEVTYRVDPTLYIQRLTEPDADMIADSNITSGQYFMVGNTLYKATANIASGATISPNVNCTRKSLSEALNELNA